MTISWDLAHVAWWLNRKHHTVTSHECDSVSGHRHFDCLLNSEVRLTTEKTSMLGIGGHYGGNSTGDRWTPKEPTMRKTLPCHDVFMLFPDVNQNLQYLSYVGHYQTKYHGSKNNLCKSKICFPVKRSYPSYPLLSYTAELWYFETIDKFLPLDCLGIRTTECLSSLGLEDRTASGVGVKVPPGTTICTSTTPPAWSHVRQGEHLLHVYTSPA